MLAAIAASEARTLARPSPRANAGARPARGTMEAVYQTTRRGTRSGSDVMNTASLARTLRLPYRLAPAIQSRSGATLPAPEG